MTQHSPAHIHENILVNKIFTIRGYKVMIHKTMNSTDQLTTTSSSPITFPVLLTIGSLSI